MGLTALDNGGSSGAQGEQCGGAAPRLESRDVTALLGVMAELASWRHDSRRWRVELLEGMSRLLPASPEVLCSPPTLP